MSIKFIANHSRLRGLNKEIILNLLGLKTITLNLKTKIACDVLFYFKLLQKVGKGRLDNFAKKITRF